MHSSSPSDKAICLYLHAHQPYRLSKVNYLDLGSVRDYFQGPTNDTNQVILEKVSKKSYLPTNKLLVKLLKKLPGLRISLSISGTLLEQLQTYEPKVLASFQELVATGQVEILSETYYHSLAAIYSVEEFCIQVEQHRNLIKKLFDYDTTSFRNTELIYNDRIASLVNQLGFQTVLAEGWDKYLTWRNSGFVYKAQLPELESKELQTLKGYRIQKPVPSELKLLLKHYKLSDDIAFRFSNQDWAEYPLSAEKYLSWVNTNPGNLINLFMDYETFGEHQWADSGIFKFLEAMIFQASDTGIQFKTISEAARQSATDTVSVPELTSWADAERDLSAWNGNKMQQAALRLTYAIESKLSKLVNVKPETKLSGLYNIWRKLQTSDHFYYMSTKYWADGDVHKYFSPYDSPYEAFINFMNVLEDFTQQVDYIAAKNI